MDIKFKGKVVKDSTPTAKTPDMFRTSIMIPQGKNPVIIAFFSKKTFTKGQEVELSGKLNINVVKNNEKEKAWLNVFEETKESSDDITF